MAIVQIQHMSQHLLLFITNFKFEKSINCKISKKAIILVFHWPSQVMGQDMKETSSWLLAWNQKVPHWSIPKHLDRGTQQIQMVSAPIFLKQTRTPSEISPENSGKLCRSFGLLFCLFRLSTGQDRLSRSVRIKMFLDYLIHFSAWTAAK